MARQVIYIQTALIIAVIVLAAIVVSDHITISRLTVASPPQRMSAAQAQMEWEYCHPNGTIPFNRIAACAGK